MPKLGGVWLVVRLSFQLTRDATRTRRISMVNSVSMKAQCPGEGEEHVALLVDLRRFGLLRRWDDLLDEGVVAVFGVASGEAELLALFFHAGRFTPDRAATWLAERGFKPLLFVPNSGKAVIQQLDGIQSVTNLVEVRAAEDSQD
jgi:hypothetical protein